jgi:hypothetical protein
VLPTRCGFVGEEFGSLPLDDARRARLVATLGSVDLAVARFVDIIGYHELGHALAGASGFATESHWLNELTATYFAYAFLRAEHPELATVFEELGAAKLDGYTPTHTTLANFDALYVGVGPSDYTWYQSLFLQEVTRIYEADGLAFLSRLEEVFPAGATPAEADARLSQLEQVSPELRRWVEATPDAPTK